MNLTYLVALFLLPWLGTGIPHHTTPDEFINLGIKAVEAAEYDKAITLYSAALRPGLDAKKAAIALHGRGAAFQGKGDATRALADYDESIRLNAANPDPYYSRGGLLSDKGEYDKAIADFTEAVRLNPDHMSALLSRGGAYFLKGDKDRSIEDYTQVIRANPDLAEAYSMRAAVHYNKGDHDKALADYQKALALGQQVIDDYWKSPNPAGEEANSTAADLSQSYNTQAWLLATCPEDSIRDGKRALEYARKACELCEWKTAAIIDTFAAASAETGDFDTAVKFQAWYVTLDPTEKGGKTRLELYKARKPYRETTP